ncbi:hypothetical protein HF086_018472 [Spodoptera exigua]|uniref:Uncharacterized protein n=1 Tax=Spodoptera exigua TaxID=7107 RepID=A0A922MU49_SPOEX|nr:hypothetical protein HF086_018472 [Spodoptera exigua]
MDVDATSLGQLEVPYKLDVVNIIDSCRICMAQTLNMSSIFDTDKENIVDEIHFCTGITDEVSETDLTNIDYEVIELKDEVNADQDSYKNGELNEVKTESELEVNADGVVKKTSPIKLKTRSKTLSMRILQYLLPYIFEPDQPHQKTTHERKTVQL